MRRIAVVRSAISATAGSLDFLVCALTVYLRNRVPILLLFYYANTLINLGYDISL